MDFFIKKIFDGKTDELIHLQFQKFSRGNFRNRAMIRAKFSAKGFNVSTTAEFANELVRAVAERLGEKSTNVTGIVVSTSDLTGKLEFNGKKQFMGIKQYIINGEMNGNKIIELCDNFPECFIGLSFNAGETELKIKPKAPKSAKPSTKSADEPQKIDFCKLKTTDKDLIMALIFETSDFKSAEIFHDFIIEDIDLPTDAKDPNELRRLAKRKGRIVRRSIIDGKQEMKEIKFVA